MRKTIKGKTKRQKEYLEGKVSDHKTALYKWGKDHFVGIFVFNLLIILLVLLRNSGYFHLFLPITTNIVVMVSLIAAVILLGLRSTGVFVVSLVFLIFAGILLFLKVEVWSERTMIYMFQSFVLGVLMLFFEEGKQVE